MPIGRSYPPGLGSKTWGWSRACRSTACKTAKHLLGHLDTIRRDIDYRGSLAGGRLLHRPGPWTWSPSSKTREAFDIDQESLAVREKYGKANEDFLRARRLVESGISVVTLVVGGWDTHGDNFNALRNLLAQARPVRPCLGNRSARTGIEQGRGGSSLVGEFGRTGRASTPLPVPRSLANGRKRYPGPAAISRPARSSAKPTPTASGPKACR